MANTYTEFIKEYDRAQKKKASELATLQDNLTAAEVKRDAAQKVVDKAALGDSDEVFTDAKVKLMEAEAKVDYCQIKLNQAKDSPLFNVSNEAKLREIASLQKSIEDERYMSALVPIFDAFNIATSACDQIGRLNEIAGELSGKGVDYFSPYYYRVSRIKVIRDELKKYIK